MSSYLMPDGTIPVLVSSDSADLLRSEAAALASYLEDRPEVTAQDVASMIFRTRVARKHRALAMVTDRDELIAALQAIASGVDSPAVVRADSSAKRRRVAYVFPGQGSQRPGMGKLFYEHSPEFRAEVDRCHEVFEQIYQWSPRSYLLDGEDPSGDNIRIVQPALFMQMVGIAAMWKSFGVDPAVVVGHSQGEISAAYVAGTMSLVDAIRVVSTRAIAVEETIPQGYSMAAVGIDREECEAILARNSGWAELSVVNSAHILCISGDRGTVLEVVDTLTARGQFAKEIRVQYPAHTAYVNDFRDVLRSMVTEHLDEQKFAESEIDCIGATLGVAITPDLPVDEYWFWNLRNTVRFDLAIETAANRGADTYVEIAEHPTLLLAVQENLSEFAPQRDVRVIGTSRRTATDLREFARNLGTLAVNDLGYRWDALRVDSGGPAPLPLREFPNVLMTPMKLWAPYAFADAEPDEDVGYPQRLIANWVRLDKQSLVSPRTMLVLDHTGECAELAASVCTAAQHHGAYATQDAEADGIDTVVVLLPPSESPDTADTQQSLVEFFAGRAWWTGIDSGVSDVWLVTVDGEHVVAGDGAPQPFHSAVSAGFRCIGTEHPGTTFRHLDLSAEHAQPAKAGKLVRALHTAGESDLALRGGKLYVKRLVQDESASIANTWDAEQLSHIVIIGGTGKLGLEFCEHFVRQGAQRVTLVSRSGASPAISGRLQQIRNGGSAEVVVESCDVSDESAVRMLAATNVDRPASLVIHAAVNYADVELTSITPQSVEEALASKVFGIENFVRTFPLSPDCRVVFCSSVAATLGGRGQILYAVGNRLLDAMAYRLRESGLHCVSLQWGLWSVQGPLDELGVAKVEGTGMIPMDPAAAIAVGLTDSADDGIVAAADWPAVSDVLGLFGYGPLLSTLIERDQKQSHQPFPMAVQPEVAAAVAAAPATPVTVNFADRMRQELNAVMGMTDAAAIDSTVPLVALGLDSLQALDFRKRVRTELDRDLPVAAILGGASLDDVVALMAEIEVVTP